MSKTTENSWKGLVTDIPWNTYKLLETIIYWLVGKDWVGRGIRSSIDWLFNAGVPLVFYQTTNKWEGNKIMNNHQILQIWRFKFDRLIDYLSKLGPPLKTGNMEKWITVWVSSLDISHQHINIWEKDRLVKNELVNRTMAPSKLL